MQKKHLIPILSIASVVASHQLDYQHMLLIAFADARVSSLPDTELISVSKTPDLRLSTSIFAVPSKVYLSTPPIVSAVASRVRVTLPENISLTTKSIVPSPF